MSLTIQSSSANGVQVFAFSGDLNEDASFTGNPIAVGLPLVLDLEGVKSINSVGIREWIKWVKSIPAGTPLAVRNTPKIVVDQINMISGFLPAKTVIESFYVPYYSEESSEEKMVLFQMGQHFNGAVVTAPTDIVDSAGNPMEMDVIAAKYFKFLKGE
jgi:hypothetical protein